MQLRPDYGTYIPGLVTLEGSFRIDGTSAPDDVRDGNTNLFSVARTSAGLFTVPFTSQANGGIQLPLKLITKYAHLDQVANPTVWSRAHFVLDSYDYVTRSFQIQVLKATAADNTADTTSDADDNDVVNFFMRGSIVGIGQD